MGKLLQIAVTLIFIATVSACANSGGDKWSKDESAASETSSNNNWQKDQDSSGGTRKAESSYWKEESRY